MAVALAVGAITASSQAQVAQFDGTWTVRQTGNANCLKSSPAWTMQIKGGAIAARMDGVVRRATVSSNGAFQLQSVASDGKAFILSGTLRAQSGSGHYRVDGTKCAGTFTMSRN
jgi:hypothetical protein